MGLTMRIDSQLGMCVVAACTAAAHAGGGVDLQATVSPVQAQLGTPVLLRLTGRLGEDPSLPARKYIASRLVWSVRVQSATTTIEAPLPLQLRLADASRGEYEGGLLLMVGADRSRRFLLMPKPGRYAIQIMLKGGLAVSNTVTVEVLPWAGTDSPPPSLPTPEDYLFVLHGLTRNVSAAEIRAQRIAEEYAGTLLGRYASVRLGLSQIWRTPRGRPTTQDASRSGPVALERVRLGARLEVGDPVRQEALHALIRFSIHTSDRRMARACLDLLEAEPPGEYSDKIEGLKRWLAEQGRSSSR